MIILNDLHISCQRSSGTTTASSAALRAFTLDSLESFLVRVDEPLLIAGDLFDTWQASLSDVLRTYQVLQNWLVKGHKLIVMAANHDLSTDSSKVGSLQFLMALFADNLNVQFVIHKGAWVGEGMYCVPHVYNQDLFDRELDQVPECDVLFLHANLGNNFAAQSDHSLNVAKEQLDRLPAKLVYFGHEHHARELGKAFVGGVQWPTSISDCLDRKDKFAYRLTGTTLEPLLTWSSDLYEEIDWREPKDSEAQFIRIVGSCTPEEAADMANMVVRYRKQSDAFVVGNAVKVVSDDPLAELAVSSLEDIKSFDVLGAVKNLLTARQVEILEGLA